MKKVLFLLALSLCLFVSANAQQNDAEKEAVKRVVETYLFTENDDERRQTLYEQARIYSSDANDKIKESRFTAKKKGKGVRIVSRQKIVSIEIVEDAAIVKVETDLSSDDNKIPKHFQYVSLLKTAGAWKIVSILMPKARLVR